MEPTDESNAELNKRTVLLVMDEPKSSKLAAALATKGFRTRACKTVAAALELVKTHELAAIVCDVYLENASAFSLITELKTAAPSVAIPVYCISMSSSSTTEHVNEALRITAASLGCKQFIVLGENETEPLIEALTTNLP